MTFLTSDSHKEREEILKGQRAGRSTRMVSTATNAPLLEMSSFRWLSLTRAQAETKAKTEDFLAKKIVMYSITWGNKLHYFVNPRHDICPKFHTARFSGEKSYTVNFNKFKQFQWWKHSGHPNFINPFEYDKWLPDKSSPKRIGTLTQTKPKIHRGEDMPPHPPGL